MPFRTTTAAAPPMQAAASSPEVIWYGDWDSESAEAAEDYKDNYETYPPQYEASIGKLHK